MTVLIMRLFVLAPARSWILHFVTFSSCV